MPAFPKVVKALMFFEFSSEADAKQIMADVDRFIGSYKGDGAVIYDRVDFIDRNGTSTLCREGLPWEPPVNLVLHLVKCPDAPDWESAKSA